MTSSLLKDVAAGDDDDDDDVGILLMLSLLFHKLAGLEWDDYK